MKHKRYERVWAMNHELRNKLDVKNSAGLIRAAMEKGFLV